MLTMVGLKIAADLAFYYTLVGPPSLHFGGSSGALLGCLLLVTLCFVLSYCLRNRGALRFLPLALVAGCFFLPGAETATGVVLLPAWAYAVYLAARRVYEPEWSHQVDIFSLFWKLFLVYFAFELLLRVSDEAVTLSVMMGTVMLLCSVLLMRSLRHDPQVYCQAKYQLLNLALVAAALAAAGLLSSRTFLNGCFAVLKTVYLAVAKVLVQLLFWVIEGIAKLFSWLKITKPEGKESIQLDLSSAKDILQLEDSGGGEGSRILSYILIALGALAAIACLVLVFRYLSRREGERRPGGGPADSRYAVESRENQEGRAAPGSPVQRVRQQYRRFLRLCGRHGRVIQRSYTSREVNDNCADLFAPQAEELRDIYLEARYNDSATKEDAARAKALYAEMKRLSE